jgi:hypothetical protein
MKKNVLIPMLLVIMLGGISFWLVTNNKGSKTTLDKNAMDFAVEDTAAITKIMLADKTGAHITLTRESAATWRVNGKSMARPDAIRNLLEVIKKVAVKNPLGEKARENVIKWMATGATKVEIYQGDTRIKRYYVGGETQDQLGTYMLLADAVADENEQKAETPFVMEIPGFNGYLSVRYFTNEAEWRDRTVFRYTPPQLRSIRLEHLKTPEKGMQIDLKDANTFTLKSIAGDQLPFDTIKMKQYLTYFGAVGFEVIEDKINKAKKDSILRTPPMHTITVTDTKGQVNKVQLFLKMGDGGKDEAGKVIEIPDPDRMYALVNNGQDFVLVQYYVFGKLLQEPGYFVAGQAKK